MKFLFLSALFLTSSVSLAKMNCTSLLAKPPIQISNASLRHIFSTNFSGYGQKKWRHAYQQNPDIIMLTANIFFSRMQRIDLAEYDSTLNSMSIREPKDTFSAYSLFLSAFNDFTVNEINYYVESVQPQTSVYNTFKQTVENIINSQELFPRQKRVLLNQLIPILKRNQFDAEEFMVNLEIFSLIDSYDGN